MEFSPKMIRRMALIASDCGLIDLHRFVRSRRTRNQLRILLYHQISPDLVPWARPYQISPTLFEWQLKFLKSRFRILDLEEAVLHLNDCRPLPANSVVITIDDGFKDNYLYAFPLLKKYGIPATIFLATEPIERGELLWFDELAYRLWHARSGKLEIGGLGSICLYNSGPAREVEISRCIDAMIGYSPQAREPILREVQRRTGINIPSDLPRRWMLNWNEIREMRRYGIRFGSHTLDHTALSAVQGDGLVSEIRDSKLTIEARLQEDIRLFSYPNGRFDSGLFETLKANGYFAAMTSFPKFASLESSPWALGRILPGWGSKSFQFFLSGLFSDVYSSYKFFTRPLGGRFLVPKQEWETT